MSTYCDSCGLYIVEPDKNYQMAIQAICKCTGPRGIARLLTVEERLHAEKERIEKQNTKLIEENNILKKVLEYIGLYNEHQYDLYDDSAELRRCQKEARKVLKMLENK